MFKIVSYKLEKYQQSWREEIEDVDWIDDPAPAPQRINKPDSGTIDESNYENFLTDKVEKPENENYDPQQSEQEIYEDPRDEIPTTNEQLGIPEGTKEIIYASPEQLTSDGIDSGEIIGFSYTNRHGDYAGFRTVEPHYTFLAMTTGNEILVSFDLDVNDIRAFIVGNIHPNGVRYQDANFVPRNEIVGVQEIEPTTETFINK